MVEDDRRLMKLIRESQEVKQQLLQRAVTNEEQKGFFLTVVWIMKLIESSEENRKSITVDIFRVDLY